MQAINISQFVNRARVEVQREHPLSKIAAFLVAAVFALALIVWYAFDNRLPSTDEAGHILNSLQYKELLQHPKFWKLTWLHSFLTVNPFYPPAVYVFNGALKLLLGNGRWVDTLSIVLYGVTLTLSTFGIAKQVCRSTAAAVFAAVVVNLYPQIANLSHCYLLDFPLTAAVSMGLLALLLWKQSPSWKTASLAAAAVTLACLTKQVAVAYLALPGAWCLLEALGQTSAQERVRQVCQLLLTPLTMVLLGLPWVVTNFSWIKQYSLDNANSMQSLGVHLQPGAVAFDYLVGIGCSMSPLLVAMFAIALLKIPANLHRRLVPVYLSAVGGVIGLSFLSWTFPLDRYISSCLIATAVATGCGAAGLWEDGRLGRFVVTAFTILGVLQFVSFSYCPFPLAAPNALTQLSTNLGVCLREFRGARIYNSLPAENQLAWGQEWTLDAIEKIDGHNPVWLNILPSGGIYNPHSFELLAKERGMSVRPTTSRIWTIVGDRVNFSPTTALYFQWYLIKTGHQGNQLCDKQSQDSYGKLIRFVEHSGHFEKVGSRMMPDNSKIILYRQKQ